MCNVGGNMKLTANQIRYLLTVKRLDETKHVIKSIDIANDLNFSRASVHKMLKCLKKMNYVMQEHYGTLKLTKAGSRMANECLEKYEKIKKAVKPVVEIQEDYCLGICTLIEMM